MITIDAKTLSLLKAFIAQGGKVYSVGSLPTLIEGKEADICLEGIIELDQQANAEYAFNAQRELVVENPKGRNQHVYATTKVFEGKKYHYIVNTSIHEAYTINLKTKHNKQLFAYDFLTGAISEDEFLTEDIYLEPAMSYVLLVGDKDREGRATKPEQKPLNQLNLSGTFELVSSDPNILTLDYASLSYDGLTYTEPLHHLEIQNRLIQKAENRTVYIKYSFTCATLPSTLIYLLLEERDKTEIIINGSLVNMEDSGWYIDKSFKKVAVSAFIKPGKNEVVLKRLFTNSEKVYRVKNDLAIHEAESNRVTVETEVESIYLLGDFAVCYDGDVSFGNNRSFCMKNNFVVSAAKNFVSLDNIAQDGYAFFAGSIRLAKTFCINTPIEDKRFSMSFSRPDAILTKLSLNGKKVKDFMWAPYAADITDYIMAGENLLELELVTSLRNMLGPHHHHAGELFAVGPYAYSKEIGNAWTDDYHFVRFGIEGGLTVCEYKH